MTPEFGYHQSIFEILTAIADLDDQEGPIELICLWFDDFYLPGFNNRDSFEKTVWEKGISEFESCFSRAELEAMENFHKLYAEVVDHLSLDFPTWKNDPYWNQISNAAKFALSSFSVTQ